VFSFSALKCFASKSFASTTQYISPLYWFMVSTNRYIIFLPTASAVFEGRVHGVVVQASKKMLLSVFSNKKLL
jgi:hypothetical protein